MLIYNHLRLSKALPHEQRGAAAMGTGYRHRYGRYRKLLRGFVRVCRRQVYQLHRGVTHHDESLQYPSRGAEHRENRLSEESRDADMEGSAGRSHQDRRPLD